LALHEAGGRFVTRRKTNSRYRRAGAGGPSPSVAARASPFSATNDFERTACQITSLYRTRWQIELLSRWIKQHLRMKTFLGRSHNAIRLQIVAAMIAYVLLRIAPRQGQLKIPALRFAELIAGRLFSRTPIHRIDKPTLSNPAAARPRNSPEQIAFAFA